MPEIDPSELTQTEIKKFFAIQDINQTYLQDAENHPCRLTLRSPIPTGMVLNADLPTETLTNNRLQAQSEQLLVEIVERLKQAKLLQLDGRSTEAQSAAMHSIEAADKLPLDWLRRKRDSLIHEGEDAEFYRFSRITDAPSNLRLDCAEIFLANDQAQAAKRLINQAKSINPELDGPKLEEISSQLNASLPLVFEPGCHQDDFLQIDGQWYEEKPARSSDLLPLFRNNMEVLDTDDDAFVSDREIDVALTNPSFQRADAALIAVLKQSSGQFRNLSDDEFGIENDGITVKDLKEFDRLQAEMTEKEVTPSHLQALQRAAGIIGPLERPFSNLTTNEVLSLTTAPWLRREDKNAVAAAIAEFSDAKISSDRIEERVSDLKNTYELPLSIQETLRSINERLYTRCSSLYVDRANPQESIKKMASVHSSVEFLKAISSVATNSPHLIANMIAVNSNGTYTVTFPGAKDEPVTIAPPTDAELGSFSSPTQFGMWLPIVEKAYVKYCKRHVLQPSVEELMQSL